jgi:cholest-4-en-3-one 26-monooxygenase
VPRDLDEIDLLDLDRWARDGAPHAWFTALREHAPVWRHPASRAGGSAGFWVVSGHEEVVALGRCPHVLSSDEEGGGVVGLGPGDELQEAFDETFAAIGTLRSASGGSDAKQLLTLDPPEHTANRKIVNKGFTPRNIGALEPAVRELAGSLLDGRVAGEAFDFTAEVAMPLPMQVIGDLLGVDRAQHRDLLRWSNEAVAGTDPEYDAGPGSQLTAALNLAQLFVGLRTERDGGIVADDMVQVLVDARLADEPLSMVRYTMFLLLLTTAGNETTRNAMSHGLLAFAEHPEQWHRLREDRSLVPSAVEEVLRWSSPVLYFRRNAVAPMEVAGATIEPGDLVSLWYVSANRDGAAFADATTFDVGRDPNPHVSFGGGGAHFCLGASLARLELRVLLEELLERCATIERAGPVERLRSNFLHGIKHLPVRLR